MAHDPAGQPIPTVHPANVWQRTWAWVCHPPTMTVIGIVGSCIGILYPLVLIGSSLLLAISLYQRPIFPRYRKSIACASFFVFLAGLFYARHEAEKRFHLPTGSEVASLFEQSAGKLLVNGLRVFGNPTGKILTQSGGSAEFDNVTVGTEEALTQKRPNKFEALPDAQLKDAAADIALRLRSLAERYKVSLQRPPSQSIQASTEEFVEKTKLANTEFKGTLSRDTKDIALEIEGRTHLIVPPSDHLPTEAEYRNLHIRMGRLTVLFESLSSPENARFAADYLDYISGGFKQ